jgi:hypothetical protein
MRGAHKSPSGRESQGSKQVTNDRRRAHESPPGRESQGSKQVPTTSGELIKVLRAEIIKVPYPRLRDPGQQTGTINSRGAHKSPLPILREPGQQTGTGTNTSRGAHKSPLT